MILQNILCPVDFSEDSTYALTYAAVLANTFDAVLHIVHSRHIPASVPDAMGIGQGLEYQELYDGQEEDKEHMRTLIQQVFKNDLSQVKYDVVIRYGFAVDAIADIASEVKADLVVMYTSGADNFLEQMIGTVTGQVLKNVSCPVLVLPHGFNADNSIREIVYSTDLLSETKDSIEAVVSFAKTFDAHISFVSIEKHALSQSRNVVPFALNELLSKTSYKNISFHMVENEDVVSGLQAFSEDKKADILVMTMRDRNFIKKMMEKSKTKEMVFQSKIPVLAFHQ